MLLKSGIYAIINIINDKLYIGSSIYIKDRWVLHKRKLKTNKHHSKHLQSAWNKYGEDNFIFTVIEYCMREYLLEREQYWMNKLKCNYNIQLVAGSPLGFKHSEQTKAKLKLRKISDKHKQIISKANKNRVGIKYNVNRKHTWNNCKCEACRLRFNEYKRNWRAKKKYKSQILPFIIIDNASI